MIVRGSLIRSRRGFSTIIAEVMMVLIVIIMSAIVFVWAVPTFQSNTEQDNSGAAYAEKFCTVWGNFATFAPSISESLRFCGETVGCSPSAPYVCTGASSPITSPQSGDILVPANGVCVIEATVGNVFAQTGSNLTVIGATINGNLVANYSASLNLRSANVFGFTGLYSVKTVYIVGTSFNTSGNTSLCEDGCDNAMTEDGRGTFSMVNSTVNGQIESEVGHQTVITGSTITGRMEIESTDFGQIINNKIGVLDLDQNGVIVISGNTIY